MSAGTTVWVAVLAGSVITAALRIGFVAANTRLRLPAWLEGASVLLAPAVTAGLVASRVLTATGHPALGPDAVPVALALPVAVRTRSIGWTLAVGMPAAWVTRALW